MRSLRKSLPLLFALGGCTSGGDPEVKAMPEAGTPEMDAGECVVDPECDDGVPCTTDLCVFARCLHRGPDVDGDGYEAASCLDVYGSPVGSDCDDNDSGRFPGNPEYCTVEAPAHDEDCDPSTIGILDVDGDGETDSRCSNGGTLTGTDCNDLLLQVRSRQVEFCDDYDNDCDGVVDDNPQPIPWYEDSDGDLFGGTKVLKVSCEPVTGGSVLPTDCDEAQQRVHPAQQEECDQFDNNCNGIADDNLTCGSVPGVGPAVEPGGMAAPPATQLVSVEGGMLVHLAENVSVAVPPNVLTSPLEMSVRKAVLSSLASLPPSYVAISNAYSFTPHGAHFTGGVELAIPYTLQAGGEPKVLRLNHEGDHDWKEVAAEAGPTEVKVLTETFSVYVVVERLTSAGELGDAGLPGLDGSMGTDGEQEPEWGSACPAIGMDYTVQPDSCVVLLERRPTSIYLFVSLQGQELDQNDPNGFTLSGRELHLRGSACESWRDEAVRDLEVVVTCKAVREPQGSMCLPLTCAELRAECGMVADGCGGQANCDEQVGGCGAGEACGAGGVANQCAPSGPILPDAGILLRDSGMLSCPKAYECAHVQFAGSILVPVKVCVQDGPYGELPPTCSVSGAPECVTAGLPNAVCGVQTLASFCLQACTT